MVRRKTLIMARGGAGVQSRVRDVFGLLLVAAGEESEMFPRENVVVSGLLDTRGRLTEERPKGGDARGDENDPHFSDSQIMRGAIPSGKRLAATSCQCLLTPDFTHVLRPE